MTFKDLLNLKLKDLSPSKFILLYALYLFLIIILSTIYTIFYISKFDIIDDNYNLIIKNLQFEYGPLIHNIFYNGEFNFLDSDGILYYLKRLPVFPILIYILSKISLNIFFIFVAKNIITYSLLFYFFYLYLKSIDEKFLVFLIYFLPFFIPYNLHVGLTISFADTIVSILLPSLFIMLLCENSIKYFYISLILFLLYLTKNSFMFVVIIVPFLILLLEKDRLKYKLIPFCGVILAILIWGFFGLVNTGKFPIGTSNLTSNPKTLYEVVLNKDFKKYYPYKSVDLIPKKKLPTHLKNEWEIFDYYKKKNKEYLKANSIEYLSDLIIKIKFIFFNLKKDSAFPENGIYKNPIIFSHVINKTAFIIFIIIFSISIVKKLKLKSNNSFKVLKNEIYLFFIMGFYFIPLIVGWATSKHLVAVHLIAFIYLIHISNKKLIKKN